MRPDAVQVPRRSLNLQLMLYVLFAGISVAATLSALRDFTTYPMACALSFFVSGLFLFPAFRVWKESRGRNTPSFGRFLRVTVPLAVVIFIVTSVVR